MHRTAWTKKGSSLPSDRIPPAKRSSPAPSLSKAKGKQKDVQAPKSQEVRKLEDLRDGLKNVAEKDPTGGCFCQGTRFYSFIAPTRKLTVELFYIYICLARVHNLSEYTPICRSCGLILCTLNAPSYTCSHCNTPLLTPEGRSTLISRLEDEISQMLFREEQQRQRAVDEARQAEGAFPTLLASSTRPSDPAPGALQSHPVNQSHKVLSLNSKTRKVKVSSYTTPPPLSVSLSKDAETQRPAEQPLRVPPLPTDVVVSTRQPQPDRPWARLDSESAVYIPDPQVNKTHEKSSHRKKESKNAGDSAK